LVHRSCRSTAVAVGLVAAELVAVAELVVEVVTAEAELAVAREVAPVEEKAEELAAVPGAAERAAPAVQEQAALGVAAARRLPTRTSTTHTRSRGRLSRRFRPAPPPTRKSCTPWLRAQADSSS